MVGGMRLLGVSAGMKLSDGADRLSRILVEYIESCGMNASV